MSQNDMKNDFLMELLDNEVPAEYLGTIEREVSSDAELSRRLDRFRSVKDLMQEGDSARDAEYQAVHDRLKQRLERTLDASQSTDRSPTSRKNVFEFNRSRWVHLPVPMAAAAGFFLVAALIFNFLPGNRFKSDPYAGAAAQAASGMDVVNTAEYTSLDPNMVNLLSANATSDPVVTQNTDGDGINLQINVQDVDQLIKLLQGTKNLNGGIDNINIELPKENQFELLGDSQLKKLEPQGVQ